MFEQNSKNTGNTPLPPHSDAQSAPIIAVGTKRTFTPEKAALLLEALYEQDDYIAVWDKNLRLHFANNKLMQLWGATEEQYLGKSLSELPFLRISPETVERGIKQALHSQRTYTGEFSYLLPDGRVRHAEFVCTPLFGESKEVDYVVGNARDVTDKKNAESAREDSERQYRLLFDSIEQGFCLVEVIRNTEGQCVDYKHLKVNPAFERLTGMPGAEGSLVSEAVPGLIERWGGIWCRVATAGIAERHVKKSPIFQKWFDTTIIPTNGPNSSTIALLFSDVTKQKTEELALQEADRRKDEFLATLAHELRNPLSPIQSGIELLRLAKNRPSLADDALDMMQRQVSHLVRLVDDLMEISRISKGKVRLRTEQVDIRDILVQALEATGPQLNSKQHMAHISYPPQPLLLDGDPARLVQVFVNLLSNASKYTNEGGKIQVTAQRKEKNLIIRVQDSGIGMSEETISQLFNMFMQVDPMHAGGLGIGLALVRKLVELHRGSIKACSAGTGKGSEFTVTLPALETSDKCDKKEITGTPSFAGQRILVVDDNQDAAKGLALLLQLSGAETCVASDGNSALQLYHSFRPTVMLLDLGMPGMDGFEVARRLRSELEGHRLKIVALTGWGQDEDKRKTQVSGFDAHLVKPIDLHSLSKTVTQLGLSAGKE